MEFLWDSIQTLKKVYQSYFRVDVSKSVIISAMSTPKILNSINWEPALAVTYSTSICCVVRGWSKFSVWSTKSALWQGALSYSGFSKHYEKSQKKAKPYILSNNDNGKNQNPYYIFLQISAIKTNTPRGTMYLMWSFWTPVKAQRWRREQKNAREYDK